MFAQRIGCIQSVLVSVFMLTIWVLSVIEMLWQEFYVPAYHVFEAATKNEFARQFNEKGERQ